MLNVRGAQHAQRRLVETFAPVQTWFYTPPAKPQTRWHQAGTLKVKRQGDDVNRRRKASSPGDRISSGCADDPEALRSRAGPVQ